MDHRLVSETSLLYLPEIKLKLVEFPGAATEDRHTDLHTVAPPAATAQTLVPDYGGTLGPAGGNVVMATILCMSVAGFVFWH